jgi:hypothetical protein
MKLLFVIVLSAFTLSCYGQQPLEGALYDYKTGAPVVVSKTDTTWVYLSGDKTFKYALDQNGHFSVPAKDMEKLGADISFVVDNPNPKDVTTTLACMEIDHIPADKLKLFLSKILVTKAYWKKFKSDSHVYIVQKDNFVPDNQKTFADGDLLVDNGFLKYKLHVKRSAVKSPAMYDMYIADLRTDIIN